MEHKAENVVQNIGAMAETISIFYNSMARQVPKDVALVLTQHFMDITITRQSGPTPEARAVALAAAEAHRQAIAQKRRQQKEALEQKKQDQEQHEPGQTEPQASVPESAGEVALEPEKPKDEDGNAQGQMSQPEA